MELDYESYESDFDEIEDENTFETDFNEINNPVPSKKEKERTRRTRRTRFSKKEKEDMCKHILPVLESYKNVVSDIVLKEKSVASACRENGVDYLRFRRVVSVLQSEEEKCSNTVAPKPKPRINFDNPAFYTFAEHIYHEVFDTKTYEELVEIMPLDAEETVEKLTEERLTPREKKVLLLRFSDGMTFEEVSKEFGVTHERIRQIERKAIRKLHHPSAAKYLQLGYYMAAEMEAAEKKGKADACAAAIEAFYRNALEEAEKAEAAERAEKALQDAKETSRTGVSTEIRNTPLRELDLSVRSYNCLYRHGCNCLGDVLKLTRRDLMHVRNMGKHSVEEVVAMVESHGGKIEED